jgi:hypothetical protein
MHAAVTPNRNAPEYPDALAPAKSTVRLGLAERPTGRLVYEIHAQCIQATFLRLISE